ncbi:MAG: serine dehydratase subunit alpha family protein, partial [Lachnospiraceae bacterium]|nr:serine dehydratase subunit alpha family protein [Lachnospiraceae bacterium]
MDKRTYDAYIEILRQELVPALGCTEPIAIAFGAARARDVLGCFPDNIWVCCSGNIIKNAKSVKVPNSGGLKGIAAAAVLGCTGGDWTRGLEVLNSIEDSHREQTKELLKQDFCGCSLKEDAPNLYIQVTAQKGNCRAGVTIEDYHTNITEICKYEEILFQKDR